MNKILNICLSLLLFVSMVLKENNSKNTKIEKNTFPFHSSIFQTKIYFGRMRLLKNLKPLNTSTLDTNFNVIIYNKQTQLVMLNWNCCQNNWQGLWIWVFYLLKKLFGNTFNNIPNIYYNNYSIFKLFSKFAKFILGVNQLNSSMANNIAIHPIILTHILCWKCWLINYNSQTIIAYTSWVWRSIEPNVGSHVDFT